MASFTINPASPVRLGEAPSRVLPQTASGQALAQAGGVLERIGTQIQEMRNQQRIAEGHNQLLLDIGKLRNDALLEPDPAKGLQMWRDKSQEILDKTYNTYADNGAVQDNVRQIGAHLLAVQTPGMEYDLAQKQIGIANEANAKLKDTIRKLDFFAKDDEHESLKRQLASTNAMAAAHGLMTQQKAGELSRRELDDMDKVHGLRLIDENAPRALQMLLAEQPGEDGKTKGPVYLTDLTPESREELIHRAKTAIQADRASINVLRENIIQSALLGKQPDAGLMKDVGSSKYTPEQNAELQGLLRYGRDAYAIKQQMLQTPQDQWSTIMQGDKFFSGDKDSYYRKSYEEYLLREQQRILQDRYTDIAASSDAFYHPDGKLPDSFDQLLKERAGYAKLVGVPFKPLTNSQAKSYVDVASNPLSDASAVSSSWSDLQAKLQNNREYIDAAQGQLVAQGMPALYWTLNDSSPGTNADVVRAIQAKRNGTLGKDVPDQDKTTIRRDAQAAVQAASEKWGWSAAKTAAWQQATEDFANYLYTNRGERTNAGQAAFDQLYHANYSSAGNVEMPKWYPPDTRERVINVTTQVQREAAKFPIELGGRDPLTAAQDTMNGRWQLIGDDNAFQLVDRNGIPVVLDKAHNNAPVVLTLSQLLNDSRVNRDPEAAQKNAERGIGNLFGLMPNRPVYSMSGDALVAAVMENQRTEDNRQMADYGAANLGARNPRNVGAPIEKPKRRAGG